MKGAIVITASDRPEKDFHELYDIITGSLHGVGGIRIIVCDLNILQDVDNAGRKVLRHIVRDDNGHHIGELDFNGQPNETLKTFLVKQLKVVGKDIWYGSKKPDSEKS